MTMWISSAPLLLALHSTFALVFVYWKLRELSSRLARFRLVGCMDSMKTRSTLTRRLAEMMIQYQHHNQHSYCTRIMDNILISTPGLSIERPMVVDNSYMVQYAPQRLRVHTKMDRDLGTFRNHLRIQSIRMRK